MLLSRQCLVVLCVLGGSYVFIVFLLHGHLNTLDSAAAAIQVDRPTEQSSSPLLLVPHSDDVDVAAAEPDRKLSANSQQKRPSSIHRRRRPSTHSNPTSIARTKTSADDQSLKLDVRFPVFPSCRRRSSSSVPSNSNSSDSRRSSTDFRILEDDFFYTAYLDTRLPVPATFVRVIALLRRRNKFEPLPVFRFRFRRRNSDERSDEKVDDGDEVDTELYEMCENHGRRYGGWIVSARLPAELDDSPPCWVVISRTDVEASQRREVQLPIFRMSSPSTVDFAVCVPPLFGNITSATLIQFVELSRLLGAQHFVFYVQSVTEVVRRVLDWYAGLGLVSVVSWRLPVAAEALWYNGQLVAINDCLYRTAHAFQYVLFNDLDEFLFPHSPRVTTWKQMMAEFWDSQESGAARWKEWKSVGKRGIGEGLWSRWQAAVRGLVPFATEEATTLIDRTDVCGYKFQSAFFKTHSSYNLPDSIPSYNVTSLRRTKFSRVRTKVVVLPSAVFELGIHHISRPLHSIDAARQLLPTARAAGVVVAVPPEHAFIHHYRRCTTEYDFEMECYRRRLVVDDRIRTAGYLLELDSRIQNTSAALGLKDRHV